MLNVLIRYVDKMLNILIRYVDKILSYRDASIFLAKMCKVKVPEAVKESWGLGDDLKPVRGSVLFCNTSLIIIIY